MDTSAKKILETVSIKTLHAYGFSKSSNHANILLADIASRYLANLAQTAAKYAEHAGRHTISVRDAVQAMDELGFSVDELKDYCATECRDMARYATHSNNLHDFRGASCPLLISTPFLTLRRQLNSLLGSPTTTMTSSLLCGVPYRSPGLQKMKKVKTRSGSTPHPSTPRGQTSPWSTPCLLKAWMSSWTNR